MKITREIVQALADGAPPDPQHGDYATQMQAIATALLARMPTSPAPGIHVKLDVVVDPCGRVLVGEVERLLPGETWDNVPHERDAKGRLLRSWHDMPGCVRHVVDLVVPCPLITTPQITWGGPEEEPF